MNPRWIFRGSASAALLLASTIFASGQLSPRTSVVVAADGSGDFRTVQEAINAAPVLPGWRQFLIRLKPGTYTEKVIVPADKGPIKLLGDDAQKTIITFHDGAKTPGADGKEMGTFATATIKIESTDFVAENVTFANTYGTAAQAVAVNLSGMHSTFRGCRFLGWQDTLFVNTGWHYLERCFIEGRVDFIFGGGTAYFDRCEIHCLAGGFITAPSTSASHPYGFVFSRCRITAAPGDWKTFLGRPWRPNGSTIFLETTMPAEIRPEGWENWRNVENEKTARFAEYASVGPGANPAARVPWSRQLDALEASAMTVPLVLKGWDPNHALTPERIAALPDAERAEWEAYLDRSRKLQLADRAVLAKEVAAANLPGPLKPPTNGDFKLPGHHPSPDWWGTPEARQMADAAVSFQTPAGGWSKKVAMTKGLRQPGMQWSAQCSPADPWHYVGTFDNNSTTEHMRLLAGVYGATRNPRYAAAFLKGLDYIFDAQMPNGGWPQTYPLEGGYHDNVTFNDNAMVNVLELLTEVADGAPEFAFVDPALRAKAAAAVKLGVQCILDAQIKQGGVPTVWCAQHEPLTLAPVRARLMEPTSLSGGESQGIVEFLMAIPKPSPQVVRSIDAALAWFERSKVTGLRKVKRDGRTFYEKDPASPEIYWARFYDPATNRPIFSGAQDGRIYADFAEFWRNSTTGYDYYTARPIDLITKAQKKWRQAFAKSGVAPQP
jgi:PelA/Pel-15E family pectate lyase